MTGFTVPYSGGSSGSGSDPYGLSQDTTALYADDFNSDSGLTYTSKSAGAGSVATNQANHRLEVRLTGTSNTNLPGIAVPVADFGGAIASGDWIEAQINVAGVGDTGTAVGCALSLTDGLVNASKISGVLVYDWGTDAKRVEVFTNVGTFGSPFGSQARLSRPSVDARYRIQMTDGDTWQAQISLAGGIWMDAGAPIDLDFTPTHIGFVFTGTGLVSIDYLRRGVTEN